MEIKQLIIKNEIYDLKDEAARQALASVYTKAQVNALIDAISQFQYVTASILPKASGATMFKIYLIPSDNAEERNIKDEYITIEDGGAYKWEQIGSTAVDLSGYPTDTEMNEAIANARIAMQQDTTSQISDVVGWINEAYTGVEEYSQSYGWGDLMTMVYDAEREALVLNTFAPPTLAPIKELPTPVPSTPEPATTEAPSTTATPEPASEEQEEEAEPQTLNGALDEILNPESE